MHRVKSPGISNEKKKFLSKMDFIFQYNFLHERYTYSNGLVLFRYFSYSATPQGLQSMRQFRIRHPHLK